MRSPRTMYQRPCQHPRHRTTYPEVPARPAFRCNPTVLRHTCNPASTSHYLSLGPDRHKPFQEGQFRWGCLRNPPNHRHIRNQHPRCPQRSTGFHRHRVFPEVHHHLVRPSSPPPGQRIGNPLSMCLPWCCCCHRCTRFLEPPGHLVHRRSPTLVQCMCNWATRYHFLLKHRHHRSLIQARRFPQAFLCNPLTVRHIGNQPSRHHRK